jgi:hypothetical protein
METKDTHVNVDLAYAVQLVHATCCLAGSASYLDDVRADLRGRGISRAIRDHDNNIQGSLLLDHFANLLRNCTFFISYTLPRPTPFVDRRSTFVHTAICRWDGGTDARYLFRAGLVIAVLASLAALFAALCFFRMRPQASASIVRGAVEDQARGLRQELGRTLASFQDVTLKALGTLRDGIDVQIRTFGERLDAGGKATGESITTISTKLTHDMEQTRGEANTGRETLRGLIEQKLEQSIELQTDSAKILREELGGNFDRLGIRVTGSLAETGQIQLERQLPLSARCLKNRRRRRKTCVSRWKAALTQFVKTMP